MKQLNFGQIVIVISLGLLGWVLCGAIMFIGMSLTSMETTLVAHSIGAPVIFSLISWFFFKKLRYISPLQISITLTS